VVDPDWCWREVMAIAVVATGLVVLGLLGLGATLAMLGIPPESSTGAACTVVGSQLVECLAIGAGVALVFIAHGVQPHRLGLRRASPTSLWIGLVLGLLCVPVVGLVATGVRLLLGEPITNPQLMGIAPGLASVPAAVATTVLVGLAVPFAEEVFFRGVVFPWLRAHAGFATSALLSSAAFGAMHLDWSIAAGTFVLGLAAAWTYERSGSIWPAVTVHATNNSVVLIALLTLTDP